VARLRTDKTSAVSSVEKRWRSKQDDEAARHRKEVGAHTRTDVPKDSTQEPQEPQPRAKLWCVRPNQVDDLRKKLEAKEEESAQLL
jgi:hypothetical protein